MGPEPASGELLESGGPWPFISRRVWRAKDGSKHEWSSRHHRKGLLLAEGWHPGMGLALVARCLWMPGRLNWWIGMIFVLGSSLFALGSSLFLYPDLAAAWSISEGQANAIFFAGSIPFTTAAFLQLWQAAHAADIPAQPPGRHARVRLLEWRPKDIGWLSCFLQFCGTILFNFNTYDAMLPALSWVEQELVIWAPNILGSLLFLASGHLAFSEVCHKHWDWQARSVTWWVVFANLLGCIAFLVSAVTGIVLPGGTSAAMVTVSLSGTLIGALCFLVGALLSLAESAGYGS